MDIFLTVEFITTYSIFGVRGGVRVYECVVNNLLFIIYTIFITRPFLSVLVVVRIVVTNFVFTFGGSVACVEFGCCPYMLLERMITGAGVMPTR